MKKIALSILCLVAAILPVSARPIVALSGANQLLRFDSSTPGTIAETVAVSGLASGDQLQAIDYRPATGVLYGAATNGSNLRVYTIDAQTGAATPIKADPVITEFEPGSDVGFDFNPVTDRIRIVNREDQSFRVNPDNGVLVSSDTPLHNDSPALEEVDAVAYDRNDRSPATNATTLFGIDFTSDSLVRIGGVNGTPTANGGAVTTIGPLNVTSATGDVGFDIGDDGVAYASIPVQPAATKTYGLYTINLATGAATLVGNIGDGLATIRGIAVIPKPVTNLNTSEVFGTIQAAIDDADTASGHVIAVNPGTYSELVTVSKAVTLRGAKAGVDARGPARVGAESIVRGATTGGTRTTSFHVLASSVVIDGFTVQEQSNSAQFGAGIVLAPNTTNTRVENNVLRSNSSGIYLSGSTANVQTVIRRNLFIDNNAAGTTSGTAIYSDQTVSGGTLLNVLINENSFIQNNNAAVLLGSTTAASQSRIVISNNNMIANGNGVLLFNTVDSVIARNTITGSTGSQVVLGGGVNRLTIVENSIVSGQTRGIRIGEFGGGGTNTAVTVLANSIENNGGPALEAGLEIGAGTYNGGLAAAGNWWGSATGPKIATNPGGSGQTIDDSGGQVNFSGFLAAGVDQQEAAPGFQPSQAVTMFGVDATNNLVRFSSADPGSILSSTEITGLEPGEAILGIDFRFDKIFAVGSSNAVYVIDQATAVASDRVVLHAAAGDDNPFTALTGTSFGMSFDPKALVAGNAALCVISNSDQNLRISLDGSVRTDTTINPAGGGVNAIAFTNVDSDPATDTILCGYLFASDQFIQIATPSSGARATVGASGVIASAPVNFDIETVPGGRNIGFASIQVGGGATTLYMVNLPDGLLVPVGSIGDGVLLSRGLALAPVGVIQFSSPSYTVSEAGGNATITVIRPIGSEGSVSVRVTTQDGSATSEDYTGVDLFLTFASGEISKTFDIPITNDAVDESDETITLLLSGPTGDAALGTVPSATLTIVDKTTPTLTPVAGAPATVGSPLTATVSLTGSTTATGTMIFNLYAPGDSTCSNAPIFTSTVPVGGDGNYSSEPFTPAKTGTYQFVASYGGDGNNNAAAGTCGGEGSAITVGTATVLGNISTRLRVESGDNVLIGGFIITGTQPKKLIVRANGPSLEANGAPVPGRLENPTLELFEAGNPVAIATNDNWVDAANKQEIIDSTVAPTNDLESAIVTTLPANSSLYTAIVRGVDNATGVGLVEVYDLDGSVDSKLANISTRGLVQTGDNVMIGGFFVVGSSSEKVVVRAIGPSLPVEGKLADPTLELRDGNGALVDANDNWRSDHEAEIVATTVPPGEDAESAVVQTLQPGPYTAVVRGANDTTGIALVEVYGLQ